MIIQAMRESDLDPVLEIERASFLNPWGREAFIDELKKAYARNYVILHDTGETRTVLDRQNVDGYACFNVAADELHLLKMAVRPDMRRRNIALHLLETCFRLAAAADIVAAYLEVRRSNKAAMNLYEKLGFSLIAVRPDYYPEHPGKREDALIMRKILKGGTI